MTMSFGRLKVVDRLPTAADVAAGHAKIRESELRLRAEIAAVRREISEVRTEILKWVIVDALGFRTVVIVGGVAAISAKINRPSANISPEGLARSAASSTLRASRERTLISGLPRPAGSRATFPKYRAYVIRPRRRFGLPSLWD
jgi:hypothetical protein